MLNIQAGLGGEWHHLRHGSARRQLDREEAGIGGPRNTVETVQRLGTVNSCGMILREEATGWMASREKCIALIDATGEGLSELRIGLSPAPTPS